MLDRKVLKEKGKAAFKANYWMSVLASLILSALTGASTAATGSSAANNANDVAGTQSTSETLNEIKANQQLLAIIIGVVVTVIVIAIIVNVLADVFFINPMELGCKSFFLKNADDPNTQIDEIKTGFAPSYKRNIKTLFLRDLKVTLWSLLLIVPGIMKSFAYAQVPYILAENPDMEPKEVLDRSESMMIGHRMELFKLELSFLGWDLLSIITLGLADLFFVGPYTRATRVEFYKALKENY